MDILKKIFPLSWAYTKDVTNLIIGIIIYAIGGGIAATVFGLLAAIPFIGFIFGAVAGIIGLYSTAGIVLQILIFTKVIKD